VLTVERHSDGLWRTSVGIPTFRSFRALTPARLVEQLTAASIDDQFVLYDCLQFTSFASFLTGIDRLRLR
jgi:hypothetical protein